jgi:hypothetical protein
MLFGQYSSETQPFTARLFSAGIGFANRSMIVSKSKSIFMRTKTFLLLVLLGLSNASYSQSHSLQVEKFKNTDNYIVSVANPAASKVVFNIKDNEGKSLWQESVMFAEKIRKVLFLGSLSPGTYSLEAFNGHETKTASIRIDGADKTIHPDNGKSLVVGFSKANSDHSINVIVQNKLNKDISLKIFKGSVSLNEENLGSQELIRKIVKLPEIEKGEYVIKVGTRDNIYQYKIDM